MSKVRTSSGHVLSVQSRTLGSSLDGDHSAGVTTLTVQDCADFDDETGGWLTLNGTTYAYSAVDDDASTLTVSPALAADASDGDDATMLDPIHGSPQSAVTASVTEDGEDPGDSIEADVASDVIEQLPEGVRGLAGEAVTLTWDEDDNPTVSGLVGVSDSQAGFLRGHQDFATASGDVDVTIDLTYQPLPDESLQVKWGGLDLYDDEYTVAADRWSITVPTQGFKSGDRFMAKYHHNDSTRRTTGTVDLTAAYLGFDASLSGSSIVPTAGANNSVIFIIPTPELAVGRRVTLEITGTFSDSIDLASMKSCDSAGYTGSVGYVLHTGNGVVSPMTTQTMTITIAPGVEHYDDAVTAGELFIQVDVLRATSVDSITYTTEA